MPPFAGETLARGGTTWAVLVRATAPTRVAEPKNYMRRTYGERQGCEKFEVIEKKEGFFNTPLRKNGCLIP